MVAKIDESKFKSVMVSVCRQAKTQCACFLGRNSCVFQEKCTYFQDNIERCPYYELYVLPGDQSLYSKYMKAFGLQKNIKETKVKKVTRRRRRRRKE